MRKQLFYVPAFQFRDFRLLSLAAVFQAFGMMGEMVAMGWTVLELTDSPFMVGVTSGLRMAPLFLLGIPAGAITDVVDRRPLVRNLSAAMAVPTGTLGLLLMAGSAEVWHVLAISFLAGGIQAFHQTARQSFAYDIVGPSLAVNGLAIIMLAMRLGGLVGSIAVGSVMARIGLDIAFFVLAGSYVSSALVLLFVRSRGQAAPIGGNSALDNLKEYARELRTNRILQVLVLLTGGVEMLGFSHQVLLPSLARDVLGVGAGGLGIMAGLRSLGGILGILVLAGLGDVRRKGLLFLGVIYMFGASLVALGYAPSFFLVTLVLTALNAMASLSDILSQSMMQLNVPNDLRGRAMGSWVLAVGTAPGGHLQVGALASFAGVAFALAFNGFGLVVLATVAALLSPRLRRL